MYMKWHTAHTFIRLPQMAYNELVRSCWNLVCGIQHWCPPHCYYHLHPHQCHPHYGHADIKQTAKSWLDSGLVSPGLDIIRIHACTVSINSHRTITVHVCHTNRSEKVELEFSSTLNFYQHNYNWLTSRCRWCWCWPHWVLWALWVHDPFLIESHVPSLASSNVFVVHLSPLEDSLARNSGDRNIRKNRSKTLLDPNQSHFRTFLPFILLSLPLPMPT